MGVAIKLKDLLRTKRRVLLDTNVLPCFVTERRRRILERSRVFLSAAPFRLQHAKRVLAGRFATSMINVVESMAERSASPPVAQALWRAYVEGVDGNVLRPRTAPATLTAYAERGEASQQAYGSRCEQAQLAILEADERTIWTEADARPTITNLQELVAGFAMRDRGWADTYTAQTAIDHDLVVLTEDPDFQQIDRVHFLVDYGAT